jgi:hypothetical protein
MDAQVCAQDGAQALNVGDSRRDLTPLDGREVALRSLYGGREFGLG